MSTRTWFTLTHSTNSIRKKTVKFSALKKIHKTLPENERKWLFWLSFLWVVSSDLRQAVSWSLLFIKRALWKYFTVHKCIIYRSGVAKIWIYKFNIYQAKNSAGFLCTERPATFQVVSRRSLTSKARVGYKIVICGIYNGKCNTGTVIIPLPFKPDYFLFPLPLSSSTLFSLITVAK